MGRLPGAATSASSLSSWAANCAQSQARSRRRSPQPARRRSRCASPRRWPAPGCARGARPSAGSSEGRVAVNGKVLTTPAHVVEPERHDHGRRQAAAGAEAPRLWRYHKPKGLVTSHKDPQGRQDRVRGAAAGAAARRLGRPPRHQHRGAAAAHQRRRAGAASGAAEHRLAQALPRAGAWRGRRKTALDRLAKGIAIDGVHYGPVEATIDRVQGANVWLTLGLARRQEPRGEAARRSISGSRSTG